MRKAPIFIVLAFLLVLCAAPVYANGIPPLPHAFYGDVTINGSPASSGTTIEARGDGVLIGVEGNPITTTESGKYGKAGALEPKLIVQGNILDGATITLYVNGHSTGQTAVWHSGKTTEVDLSATISGGGGPGGGGPGGGGGRDYIDTNLFGAEDSFRISSSGEILETIEATSADGMLTITIPEGTIVLDENGDPLDSLETAVDESPPDPPEDAYIIGLAYDFGPDGATFDPPITFTFTYDPDDLPDGVDEEDLVLAYYDEDAGEWVELDCTVDPDTHTITASVSHFTTFAIIAVSAPPTPVLTPAIFTPSSLSISPPEVYISEPVSISVLVVNTGEEAGSYTVTLKISEVVEATAEITLAGGASETVTFAVVKDKAGTYSVEVDGLTGSFTVKEAPPPPPTPTPSPIPPSKVNWAILGPIIGVAVFLAIFLPIRLRRRGAG